MADAAVIGIYDQKEHTELPRAYIVPKTNLDSLSLSDKVALSKEIADWVSGHVASYKRLRGGVVLIDLIPKTASGKILRKDLRVMAEKQGGEVKAKL